MIWTEQEIDILKKEIAKKTPLNDIAIILKRTFDSLNYKKEQLKLKYEINRHWTNEDTESLKQLNNQGFTKDEIAIKLNRNISIIREKIRNLGIPKLHKKSIIYDRKWANEISQIVDLYVNQHLSADQIHFKLGIGVDRIKKELRKNNIEIRSNRYRFKSPETIDKIIDLYVNEHKTIQEISDTLKQGWQIVKDTLKENNIKICSVKEVRRKRIPEETKQEILRLYQETKSQRCVCQTLSLSEHIVREVLKQNNIKLLHSERFRHRRLTKLTNKDELEICRLYKEEELGKMKIVKKFHIGPARFKEILEKYGYKLKTFSSQGMPSDSSYSRGYGGKYDGKFFKSLSELTFMILLNKREIYWRRGESKNFRILYIYKNEQKKYFPDIIIENRYIVEVKPKEFWNEERVINKEKAAIEFCKNNNFLYRKIDMETNKNLIRQEYKNGTIKFDSRRKQTEGYVKFIEFLNS